MTNPSEPRNRHDLPKPYQTHPHQRAKISMIATPIGNLGDLTARAREALMNADELWCEDTRHTQALLNALSIERKRLKRVDQHTSDAEMRKNLEMVRDSGQWIGVVTDAGTPGLSDPGALIASLISEFPEIRLEPLPGPSALTSFISIAGLHGTSFQFQGFFPRSENEGLELLNDLKDRAGSLNWIFFESPNRIQDTVKTLTTWSKALDFTPKFIFTKELSKIHETIWMGEGVSFLEWLELQAFDARGEWVFGIVLPKNYVKTKNNEAEWELTLECLLQAKVSPKEATQIVVGRFSVAKNLAYKTAIEISKKINI